MFYYSPSILKRSEEKDSYSFISSSHRIGQLQAVLPPSPSSCPLPFSLPHLEVVLTAFDGQELELQEPILRRTVEVEGCLLNSRPSHTMQTSGTCQNQTRAAYLQSASMYCVAIFSVGALFQLISYKEI